MNAEQAAQITDLESYKSVTGAKRFKRSKEEMALGLSPEDALVRRLKLANGEVVIDSNPCLDIELPKAKPRRGDIVIHLRPAKGVDADYFEHVPQTPIEIVVDEKWYSWFDTRAITPYDGDVQRLLAAIFDRGMNEIVGVHKL